MRRHPALKAVSAIATDQWGLVTTAQAKLAGLSSVDLARLHEAGLIESAGRGVYLVGGAPTPDHLEIKLAWLRLDPARPAWQRHHPGTYGGVASHTSACELRELGDIPASSVEITVPARRTTREPGVKLHQAAVDPSDVTIVDGLPVTTAERTVADLLAARADGGHVGKVVADALRLGQADRTRLATRIAPFTKAYGLPRSASGPDFLTYLLESAETTLPAIDREATRRALDIVAKVFEEHGESGGLTAIKRLLDERSLEDGS
ncbi:type IV toxin-antitoxin system AbiEi family antitoxin domain-containing protein [Herbidospora yilanensis]|uniref:type IV toxin-antitoxin system AbiEi family antitoxin domain-containing protein n=1 Tax=Herbidospora yilanensis TaxID=354426 RepID=UPI000A02E04A|nr:type IV toxin-antitoxin system AbiEi family antitoxin domain-containing protein [Herbidospora yilanensis]